MWTFNERIAEKTDPRLDRSPVVPSSGTIDPQLTISGSTDLRQYRAPGRPSMRQLCTGKPSFRKTQAYENNVQSFKHLFRRKTTIT